MIFASLEIEREPPKWGEFSSIIATWFQDAGVIACTALVIWCLAYLLQNKGKLPESSNWFVRIFIGGTVASVIFYVLFLFLLLRGVLPIPEEEKDKILPTYKIYYFDQYLCLTLGGICAVFTALLPMIYHLWTRLSWGRIWAITILTLKEAIRGRVAYVFTIMGLVFLFAGWFVDYKPEDQIRNFVTVVYWSMSPLFLLTAALLGAFNIPTDVTKQSIHTIVTKPVEKYEIVLGRFLGHAILLTVALAVLSTLSLLYVVRGINPAAAEESYKARVAEFADSLTFYGTKEKSKGISVGREWTYRSYIRGRQPGTSELKQYAIWSFDALPDYLANRKDPVLFEFTFDIFRTTKGTEDKGVICNLLFVYGGYEVSDIENPQGEGLLKEFREELRIAQEKIENRYQKRWERATSKEKEEIEAEKQKDAEAVKDLLIQKYKIFEAPGIQVTDYHTQYIYVPTSLFEKLIEEQRKGVIPEEPHPILKVLVSVNEDPSSRNQLLGVARRDLYLLADTLPFWQNFLKGVVGLWCNMLLVLSIAVACSTYLSGIISFLTAMFFLGSGLVIEFIRDVAAGKSVGGGPLESAFRLFNRKPLTVTLEESAMAFKHGDVVYQFLLNFVLKLIPDVHRFYLTEYVSNGFNIPVGSLLFLDIFLPMLGYMIPWFVLAYYMMNSREIANPM